MVSKHILVTFGFSESIQRSVSILLFGIAPSIGNRLGIPKGSNYWCFGETAWGDQYAYRLDSLRAGNDSAVYFLDAMSMSCEQIATSLETFLEKEFLRVATLPYDPMMIAARKKFGFLEPATHLVYMPPLPLGGTEDIDHLEIIPACAAMILNGDIARQLEEADSEQVLKGLEPFEDEQGRPRVRLVWV
jgi:hypothetical protein